MSDVLGILRELRSLEQKQLTGPLTPGEEARMAELQALLASRFPPIAAPRAASEPSADNPFVDAVPSTEPTESRTGVYAQPTEPPEVDQLAPSYATPYQIPAPGSPPPADFAPAPTGLPSAFAAAPVGVEDGVAAAPAIEEPPPVSIPAVLSNTPVVGATDFSEGESNRTVVEQLEAVHDPGATLSPDSRPPRGTLAWAALAKEAAAGPAASDPMSLARPPVAPPPVVPSAVALDFTARTQSSLPIKAGTVPAARVAAPAPPPAGGAAPAPGRGGPGPRGPLGRARRRPRGVGGPRAGEPAGDPRCPGV